MVRDVAIQNLEQPKNSSPVRKSSDADSFIHKSKGLSA